MFRLGIMKDKEKLILAALLHDIGKFWQRAGESGKHAEVSNRFIRDYVPKEFQSSGGLVAYHHGLYEQPSRGFTSCRQDLLKFGIEDIVTMEGYEDLKKLIVSDWLSSGEREESENEESGKPKITPLISIFSQISLKSEKEDDSYNSQWEYPLNSLCLGDSIFPIANKLTLSEGDYRKLWNEFMKDINWIKDIDNFDEYFNKLYYILQKYTWCIPSAVYKSKPDVSLFDHLKTTTAIVSCLYGSNETYLDNCIKALHKKWKIKQKLEENIKKELKEKQLRKEEIRKELEEKWKQWVEENKGYGSKVNSSFEEKRFSLIHGDISGIQNFIYSIKTKYATKSLKGRMS